MQVRKRNGDAEPADMNKIVRAVQRCAGGLGEVDPMRIATKTISGLYDGASTAELDRLSIQTAAEMTGEEPQYSRLAARLLAGYIGKEVRGQGIASFSQSVSLGHAEGLIGDQTATFVKDNARKLDDAVSTFPAGEMPHGSRPDLEFEYFGIKTVYDRYLLRHPTTRLVTETMGLQDVFFALRLPFDSLQARELSARIAEEIYLTALEASADLAEAHGPHPAFAGTRAAQGQLQPDLWPGGDAACTEVDRWQALRKRIKETGLRNSLLIAIAPTATIASIAGCYECVEPQVSNLFKRETMSGEFLQVNTALVAELKAHGQWTPAVREEIKRADGSVQQITALPEETRRLFRTAWELPQRALIDLAAARGPFIDQSQSLNLFLAAPTIGKLSSMYLHAWKSGLKTTYYLRSRPATRIQQATVALPATDSVSCSLENPETCEACQ